MTLDFLPSADYPSNTVTDGQFLYRSLGSFWANLFADKAALKGYTLGMAEELIQSYYNLVEVVKQFSVKDIDILHKERWKALLIKKSEFNALTVQAGDGLVFGKQPITDALYANKLFRVGYPKESSNAYSFKPPFSVKKFGALANRILSPSLLLLPGIDIIFKDDALLFNKNLFTDSNIPRAKLITADGTQATYTDTAGNVIADEFIVLWLYNVEQDNQELYNNFGVLFDLRLPTSQNYKDLLKALMNLAVEGPTIVALNKALAALMDVPIIIEPNETVEDIYDLRDYTYIVTDKNVYRSPIAYQLYKSIVVGATLHAGDILTDNARLYDTAIDPSWWTREVATDKLGFASHVFAASPKRQLFFSNTSLNTPALITYAAATGRIVFPLDATKNTAADIRAFQDYINLPENKTIIMTALGLTASAPAVAINPLDFVFGNFFKNNSLFLRVLFYSDTQISSFFNLLGEIRAYLPPHVYLLTYVNLQRPVDELINLNSSVSIAAYPGTTFCADGSTIAGARPGTTADPLYYKDYVNRMFCASKGPLRLAQPLLADGTAKYGDTFSTKTNVVPAVYSKEVPLCPTVTTFAGPPTPLSARTLITDAVNAGSVNGTGPAARFYYPRGLVIDPVTKDILVVDSVNNCIRRMTRAGVVTTFAGLMGTTTGGSANGSLLNARFSYPADMVFDLSGNLYVTDAGNQTIRKITPAGIVSTLAGSAGNAGSVNGNGTSAKFSNPEGITADSSGNLYVADSGNSVIRKITPAADVSTFAGAVGIAGSVDGTATVARFNSPRSIAIDSADNLYVADFITNCIRKITPAGYVTTIAGNTYTLGNVNGAGGTSTFFQPMGVAVDGNFLYVTEHSNAVRKIDLTTFQTRNVIDPSPVGQQDGSGTDARFSIPLSIVILNPGRPDLGVLISDFYNHIIRSVVWAPVCNLDTIYMSSMGSGAEAASTVEGATGETGISIKCGILRTAIPGPTIYPGETIARGPTNREVPSILLVDF